MKKLIAMSLVMTFIAAALTGCGGSEAADNESLQVENAVSETEAAVTDAPVTDEVTETVTTAVTAKQDTKPLVNQNAGNFKENQKLLKYIGDEITGFIEIPDDFAEVYNFVESGTLPSSMLTRQQGCTSDMGMITGLFAYDSSLGLTLDTIVSATKQASESNTDIISSENKENVSFGPYNAFMNCSAYNDGATLYTWIFETDDGIIVAAECEVTDTYSEFADKVPSLYTKTRNPLFDGPEDGNLINADSINTSQTDIQDPFKDSGEMEVRISPNDSSKARVGTAEYGYVDIPLEWLFYEDDENKYYISESGKLCIRTTLLQKGDSISELDTLTDMYVDYIETSFIGDYPDAEINVENTEYCDSKYTGKKIVCRAGNSEEYYGEEFHFFADDNCVLHMIKVEIHDASEESYIDSVVKSFSFE